jgi:hypothetical protein
LTRTAFTGPLELDPPPESGWMALPLLAAPREVVSSAGSRLQHLTGRLDVRSACPVVHVAGRHARNGASLRNPWDLLLQRL